MTDYNKQLIVISDYSSKYPVNKESFPWLKRQIKEKNIIYTGLTPGPEMQAALYAYRSKIPFVAVIPYKNYPYFMYRKHKNEYYRLIKKAVKVVYVDRELEYISHHCPPDYPGQLKENNQISWLMGRISKYPGITKVISYTHGFYSTKNRNLHFYLHNTKYEGKWHLIQRTHLSLDETVEDDLPF